MKVVCDEGVPRALTRRLRELGVDIVGPAREWFGLTNGRLIATVTAAGFDILLSNDKNLVFQVNLAQIRIGIVTLPTNRRPSLVPRSTDIADTLRRAQRGQFVVMSLDGSRAIWRIGAQGAAVTEAIEAVRPFYP